MADNNVFFEKVAKQLFIAGAKKVFPSVMAPIAGVLGDEGFGYLKKKVKENDFQKEYEETIKRLYPGKYELINTYVERITEKNDLWQTLLDDEFDFEKVANTLIKQFLSPKEVCDLDDRDKAGIKTALHFMIDKAYKNLCSLEEEDVKKWLVEQTAKNGHSIEKQEIKIEELRLFFNQQAATIETALKLILVEAKRNDKQDSRLDNHEARLGKVEKGTPKGIPDRAETFKARWNRHLFLEEDKENQEDKKKLSDVYIVPKVKNHKLNEFYYLDEFLKNAPSFTLFLGQPGVGKSTFISAYLNDRFKITRNECSVFKFTDFADRDYWSEKTGYEIAEEVLSEIGIRTAMDLCDRTIFLDGFDEISLEKTKKVDFLAKLAAWQNDELVENSKIFVTCRTNYMEEGDLDKAEIPTYEIQPFNKKQIDVFCKSLRKGIHQSSIHKLKERGELYGFPALLYIVLVLRLYESEAENTVEIYEELFSRLYKRSWDNKNKDKGHRFTTEHKSFYNRLAQRIAVYMFQHGDAAEGCPIDEIKRIGKELIKEYKGEYKNLPREIPVLIDGFYQSRFLENDQIKDFIHRTIYEYFFTQYLFETVKENENQENGDWFVQKFCRAMQYRQLSNEMQQYFFDHAGDKKVDIVGVIKKELEKALDNEQLSTESKYLQRSRYEAYVLANCLSIISKAYDGDGYWKVESEKSAEYLRLTSHTDLRVRLFLSKMNLERAHMERAHLKGADLSGANLEGVYLRGAHLEETELSGAHLERAHLEGADLEWAHLEWADLEGAELEWVDLKWADLTEANLKRAHLEWADLEWADLRRADLKWAGLTEADLEGANLTEAFLEGADLYGAYYNEDTVFPEGFDIKGKGMKLVMPSGRIKGIDSGKIIQNISSEDQNRTEEA